MSKPTTIEEVLTNLARNASVRNTVRTDIDEALATIEQLVLERVIGKDRDEDDYLLDELRAKQRQALKQLLGKHD